MSPLRVFVTDTADAGWTELTDGAQPAVRLAASDLRQARRASQQIRDDGPVSVVLDVHVLIDDDARSARRQMSELAADADSVRYAGTVDGLAGLVDDIVAAGVADGVTLVPAEPHQDIRTVAEQTLARLEARFTLRSRRRSAVAGPQPWVRVAQ
jgi:hypothetical protein